jgi:hypothetical protein
VATMLPLFSGTFQAPIVAALFMRGFYLEGLILRALAARGALHMQMPGRDRDERPDFIGPNPGRTLHRGRPKHTNAPACVTLRRTAVTVSDTFDTVPVTTPPF